MTGIVAVTESDIDATPAQVWVALTDPTKIKEYMFGSEVVTDWRPGSEIRWKGEYEGKPFEDKGKIIEVVPNERLSMTHFSPMTGQADGPENYHTITYQLEPRGAGTHVVLSQDNNATEDDAEHSRQNWDMMLTSLKRVVEQR